MRPVEAGATYYAKLVGDLADPAMEGRGPGTEGIDKARDYLVDHFQRSGLQPAFGDAYTQPLQIALGTHAATQSLAFTADHGDAQQARAEEQFQALGLSASSAFQGDAVFLGYGVADAEHHYNAY